MIVSAFIMQSTIDLVKENIMKKRIILIICFIVIVVLSTIAFTYAKGLLSKNTIYNEEKQQYDLMEDYVGYVESRESLNAYDNSLDSIPLYDHIDLLHSTNDCRFFLGRDSGFYSLYPNTRQDLAKVIFSVFPTDAIHETPDKSGAYAIYDTDIGVRLYLFFSKDKNNYATMDGFPVIMQKRLAFEDFENIRTGDSIKLVEEIDPIISQYIQFFDTGSDEALKGYTERGVGPTSIHLLTDGILKIEYQRTDGDYVITNIVYKADFILDGLNGQTCYQISELDYVK